MSYPEASDYLGDSECTLPYWINRYMQKGLQGLTEDDRPGSPSRLTGEQIEKINLALRVKPEDVGLRGGTWDGRLLSAFIQKELQINLGMRQCQRLFRQLRFRLRKPRPMIARTNPEMQEDFKKQYEAG